MTIESRYDVAIIGGGLAGLASAIELKRMGHSVIVFEKEHYPFHKVCGEYVSMESWDYLCRLGLPLSERSLPKIDRLQLTAPGGRSFETPLPLGGFGISRYCLDNLLFQLAKEAGVVTVEDTKVHHLSFSQYFQIGFSSLHSTQNAVQASVCLGAFGKRSNLDIKWKRPFIGKKNGRLQNYIGVKYHVKASWPSGLIGLHNFHNGYCGISEIEQGVFCLCYLTTAENLRKSDSDIHHMEATILFQNPHLKKIFQNCEVLPGFPVTISQISFASKTKVEDHVLLLGDAAGMITPLCGNGMSIALHSASIAARCANDFLRQQTTREMMEQTYEKRWQKEFGKRLRAGRTLQRFFGSRHISNFFVAGFTMMPFLAKPVIRATHGQPF